MEGTATQMATSRERRGGVGDGQAEAAREFSRRTDPSNVTDVTESPEGKK